MTLKRNLLANSASRESALHALRETGLCDVDESRFHRFGIASGQIEPEKLVELERLDAVEAVEPDRVAVIA